MTNNIDNDHTIALQMVHESHKKVNSVDNRLIERMTKFAEYKCDGNVTKTIVLITSDNDFARTVMKLVRKYLCEVKLVHGNNVGPDLLKWFVEGDRVNFFTLTESVGPIANVAHYYSYEVFIYLNEGPNAQFGDGLNFERRLKQLYGCKWPWVDSSTMRGSMWLEDVIKAKKFQGDDSLDAFGYSIHLYLPECRAYRLFGCPNGSSCAMAHIDGCEKIGTEQQCLEDWYCSFEPKDLTSQPRQLMESSLPSEPLMITRSNDSSYVTPVKGNQTGLSRSSSGTNYTSQSHTASSTTTNVTESPERLYMPSPMPNENRHKSVVVGPLGANWRPIFKIGQWLKGVSAKASESSKDGHWWFFVNFDNATDAERALYQFQNNLNKLIADGVVLSPAVVDYKGPKVIEKLLTNDGGHKSIRLAGLRQTVTEELVEQKLVRRLDGCHFNRLRTQENLDLNELVSGTARQNYQIRPYVILDFDSANLALKGINDVIGIYNCDIADAVPLLFNPFPEISFNHYGYNKTQLQ